eukprot:362540-Chlamydomonas_euryale.AAC.6
MQHVARSSAVRGAMWASIHVGVHVAFCPCGRPCGRPRLGRQSHACKLMHCTRRSRRCQGLRDGEKTGTGKKHSPTCCGSTPAVLFMPHRCSSTAPRSPSRHPMHRTLQHVDVCELVNAHCCDGQQPCDKDDALAFLQYPLLGLLRRRLNRAPAPAPCLHVEPVGTLKHLLHSRWHK